MTEPMIERCAAPYNAEPTPAALIAQFLTPQGLFYVRSHGGVPSLPVDHRVLIAGSGAETCRLSVGDLKRDFQEHSVTATLQCAGNRRADFQQVEETSGDPWDVGAIGTAKWTGVRLADVLDHVRVPHDPALHVAFTCADPVDVDGMVAPYGISIEMAKARHPDVLLAWAMNGEALTPDHGAPLRLIVPGYAGVRSAKWLTRIDVRDSPSKAPIQARDYKLFPADVKKGEEAWTTGLTIEAMPINAAICSPRDGDCVTAGTCLLEGYAIAYDRGISRVEVSANGGRDWRQAVLADDPVTAWTWRRWTLDVELPEGRHNLVVRAFDDTGQGQPEKPDTMWNYAGYLCTAWHHVHVHAA